MRVTAHDEGDGGRLEERVRAERDALQRDRRRAVSLALQGGRAMRIAETL